MRHFVVNPSMADSGQHVGGFLGFLGGLGSLCEKFRPSRVVVVWESGGSIRKRGTDSNYKNGRRPPKLNRYYEDDIPPTAENHTMQVSLLVKALNLLPVTQIYVRDCEADDTIGYMARYSFGTTPIILVSSDKDLYQLIDDRVQQWSPGQKKLIDRQAVIDKFGVSPENFCSARVFIGDPSDNIKGVSGVGFKNMSKWFPELSGSCFVGYKNVVEAAQILLHDKKGKTLAKIAEAHDLAEKNWKLMYLSTSRLAGAQVKKVNDQLEKQGKSNKMNLMRLLVNSGMQKFDINRHFSAINSVRKQ
jgi:DNA polymerase I